jgi:putative RecB family exonuclease
MKPDWIKYAPVPRPPLWKNLRWGRVARLPWEGVKLFVKWLSSAQEELRPNRVVDYVNCPMKYKFIRKDGRPTRPSPHLSFFGAIDKSITEFHKRFQGKPDTTVEDILGVYQQSWRDEGFTDEEEEKLFYERGLDVLRRFFEENKDKRPPDRLKENISVRIDGIPLEATVHRIDFIEKKKWLVTMYKTGQRVMEGSALANDLKSQLLYLMLRRKWPKVEIEVQYDFLVPGKKVRFRMREEEMAAARRHLHAANRGISNNEYEPNPSSLCGWCDFQAECPAWNGYVTDRTRYRLSYSKMMTYIRCPRNFKFLYVDRIAPLPRSFFSIGTSFHNCLEEFYEYDGVLKQPSFEYLVKLYRTAWVNAGFKDEAEERLYFEEGLNMLRDYYMMEINGKFKKAWAVEPYFELPIGDKFVMIGFIDRIDQLADGSFEVLDYKTEPTLRTQEEVDKDLQLTVYYWACRDAFGINPDLLSLHFTRFNKKVSTRRTPEDVKKLMDYVTEWGTKMLTEEKFEPLVNKYCSSCDHLKGCPKEQEVLAMAKAGKTVHKIDVADVKSAPPSGGPLEGEEQALHERQSEKIYKQFPPAERKP